MHNIPYFQTIRNTKDQCFLKTSISSTVIYRTPSKSIFAILAGAQLKPKNESYDYFALMLKPIWWLKLRF